MSKFLKLVVENTPSEGRGPFVVEYKDDDGKLMARLTIPDNVGSSYDRFLQFAEEVDGLLEVSQEDNEGKDLGASVDAITAIASLPDQSLSQLATKTGRNLSKAKKKMSNAAISIANKFEKASK